MSKVPDYREKVYNNYRTYARSNINITIDSYKRRTKFYRQRFKGMLPENKDAKILDLGCGEGFFLYFMNNQGYKNLLGVEVSREQINTLENLGTKFEICNDDILTFFDKSTKKFDLILLDNVLEHFNKNEIMKILEGINNILSNSGRLLISVPNAGSPWGLPLCYIDITHEVYFSPASLTEILKSTGFNVISIKGEGPIMLDFLSVLRAVFYYPIRFLSQLILKIMSGGGGRTKIQHILDPSMIAIAEKK